MTWTRVISQRIQAMQIKSYTLTLTIMVSVDPWSIRTSLEAVQ